jgi:hypothetical protein
VLLPGYSAIQLQRIVQSGDAETWGKTLTEMSHQLQARPLQIYESHYKVAERDTDWGAKIDVNSEPLSERLAASLGSSECKPLIVLLQPAKPETSKQVFEILHINSASETMVPREIVGMILQKGAVIPAHLDAIPHNQSIFVVAGRVGVMAWPNGYKHSEMGLQWSNLDVFSSSTEIHRLFGSHKETFTPSVFDIGQLETLVMRAGTCYAMVALDTTGKHFYNIGPCVLLCCLCWCHTLEHLSSEPIPQLFSGSCLMISRMLQGLSLFSDP